MAADEPDWLLLWDRAQDPELEPLEQQIRSIEEWRREGLVFPARDRRAYVRGIECLMAEHPRRGVACGLLRLTRLGNGLVGFVLGGVGCKDIGEGWGLCDGLPWYFRVEHGGWTIEVSPSYPSGMDHDLCFHWEGAVEGRFLSQSQACECVRAGVEIFRDPLTTLIRQLDFPRLERAPDWPVTVEQPPTRLEDALHDAWNRTHNWQAMAMLCARVGGPIERVRRRLCDFGLHHQDHSGWKPPLQLATDEPVCERALDQRIADAIRGLFTPDAASLRAAWPP